MLSLIADVIDSQNCLIHLFAHRLFWKYVCHLF